MSTDNFWDDETVKEFHEWIPKQPHERWVNYDWLIDTFKSSHTSKGRGEGESVFDENKINERLRQIAELEEAFNAGKFFKDFESFCKYKSKL
jgi:hypothetical protein